MVLALALTLPGQAQNNGSGQDTVVQRMNNRAIDPILQFGETDPIEEAKRLHMLNIERQKAIVSETNKLLKLAGELKAEMETDSSAPLTPAQMKKVGEIERLAKGVKEKMTLTLLNSPVFHQPPPVPSNVR